MQNFWCVFAFNNIAADFECLGVYTLKQEAESFATTVIGKKAVLCERSWGDLADHLFAYRLGALRGPLEALAEFAKSNRLKIVGIDGGLLDDTVTTS